MDSSQQLLNSWKEIGQYLNRGVRTVQRWERDLGLPVRRPRGKSRSAVVAMRSEVDHWLESCPVGKLTDQATKRVRDDREGPRFLLATAEFGITLADLAFGFRATEKEKIQKTIGRARSAYHIVLKFQDRVKLDEPVKAKLDSRLQELKTALEELGEAV